MERSALDFAAVPTHGVHAITVALHAEARFVAVDR